MTKTVKTDPPASLLATQNSGLELEVGLPNDFRGAAPLFPTAHSGWWVNELIQQQKITLYRPDGPGHHN